MATPPLSHASSLATLDIASLLRLTTSRYTLQEEDRVISDQEEEDQEGEQEHEEEEQEEEEEEQKH